MKKKTSTVQIPSTKKNAIQIPVSERIFDVCNVLFMLCLAVVMFYPMWYALVASFSNSAELMRHDGFILLPLEFTTNAYTLMMKNPMILKGTANTLLILAEGVIINLVLTSLGAYGLSRRNLLWKRPIMFFIIITMYLSGGLIPSYLLISQFLHLRNTFWSLTLPVAINTYNLIIMRTSFESIPASLEESAKLDGASHWTILLRIVLPLSMPIIAVMVLYYAVAHWNSWFTASIYITERTKYPLQLILREILINNDTAAMTSNASAADEQYSIAESVKYAVIVVATFPILCVYPFLQKYFVKGVMIGAVKG